MSFELEKILLRAVQSSHRIPLKNMFPPHLKPMSGCVQEYGQLECTPCPVGTFGRDSGADTCEVCPQGTFQDQVTKDKWRSGFMVGQT